MGGGACSSAESTPYKRMPRRSSRYFICLALLSLSSILIGYVGTHTRRDIPAGGRSNECSRELKGGAYNPQPRRLCFIYSPVRVVRTCDCTTPRPVKNIQRFQCLATSLPPCICHETETGTPSLTRFHHVINPPRADERKFLPQRD